MKNSQLHSLQATMCLIGMALCDSEWWRGVLVGSMVVYMAAGMARVYHEAQEDER